MNGDEDRIAGVDGGENLVTLPLERNDVTIAGVLERYIGVENDVGLGSDDVDICAGFGNPELPRGRSRGVIAGYQNKGGE